MPACCHSRRMNTPRLWLLGTAVTIWSSAACARTCESLATLSAAKVEVVLAQTVEAGTFAPPGSRDGLQQLPAFCRVVVKMKPSADSDVGAEIWLPANWNSKLLAVGSGGWGGSIGYGSMADGLQRGYATVATDDGHTSSGGSFAMGHPEKLIDYAYRAEHEATLEAKVLVKALYDRVASHAYWQGCSGGGREGLIQAYRYPEEFDGIIAGDPANIRRNAWALWLAVQTLSDPAAYIPPGKYAMIHSAVLAACDANDGLKDGLIEDPRNCHVDFSVLQCKAQDGPDCLTARQVKTAQIMISPATTPNGKVLFPGLEPGTELRWGRMAGGPAPADLFLDEYRYVVYQDPNWDWHAFDLARDAAKADAIDANLDEMDPHMAAFAKTRRQAAAVSRLGRSAGRAGINHRVLSIGAQPESRSDASRQLGPSVHGPRHGALLGRGGTGYLRQPQRPGAVGRARSGT